MTTGRGFVELLADHRDKIEAELKQVIDACPEPVSAVLRYHMGWVDADGRSAKATVGKLVRPTLCLLCCDGVGGDATEAVPAAAALELLHNFSLVHDDIQDASDERHHRPTVWKLWGVSQAINAGDAMLALVYLALARSARCGVPEARAVACVEDLSRACLELCRGQYLDLEYEKRMDVTVDEYLGMAAGKTAALLAASTGIGARLGGAGEGVVEAARLFGKELGMAYQIQDDILGIWGEEAMTGKSGNDISQRKKTFPVVYALNNAPADIRRQLAGIYEQESVGAGEAHIVTELLDTLGARRQAQERSQAFCRRATERLDEMSMRPQSEAILKEFLSLLLERHY